MQKIKSETFIFCFGARGKSGLHARLLRGIRPEGVEIVIQKICSGRQNPILPLRTQQVSCLLQLILPFRMKGVMATGNRKRKLEQMSFPNERTAIFFV